MKSDLQKATESLRRIHQHGGQDAPFLNRLRKDANALIQFLAASFFLEEVGQRIRFPRGWELIVTDDCGNRQCPAGKNALLLQKPSATSYLFRGVAQQMTQLWSCKNAGDCPAGNDHASREELFVFADDLRDGWLGEVGGHLAALRLANLDWQEIPFFIGSE